MCREHVWLYRLKDKSTLITINHIAVTLKANVVKQCGKEGAIILINEDWFISLWPSRHESIPRIELHFSPRRRIMTSSEVHQTLTQKWRICSNWLEQVYSKLFGAKRQHFDQEEFDIGTCKQWEAGQAWITHYWAPRVWKILSNKTYNTLSTYLAHFGDEKKKQLL